MRETAGGRGPSEDDEECALVVLRMSLFSLRQERTHEVHWWRPNFICDVLRLRLGEKQEALLKPH